MGSKLTPEDASLLAHLLIGQASGMSAAASFPRQTVLDVLQSVRFRENNHAHRYHRHG
jgi:hypothetical protein